MGKDSFVLLHCSNLGLELAGIGRKVGKEGRKPLSFSAEISLQRSLALCSILAGKTGLVKQLILQFAGVIHQDWR